MLKSEKNSVSISILSYVQQQLFVQHSAVCSASIVCSAAVMYLMLPTSLTVYVLLLMIYSPNSVCVIVVLHVFLCDL